MFKFEYIGNLHIHTLYSDGNFPISEIADKAAEAGLNFICLNDHDYMLDDLHLNEEGFYNGYLAVLVGFEHGRSDHHYLAYHLNNLIPRDLSPQEKIDQVNQGGGFGFLAHPFEKGMPFIEKSKAFPWKDLGVTDFQGICIWNFSSRFKERIHSIFHALFFLAFKTQTLKGPSRETLAFWDDLCQKRKVAAIGSADIHGSPLKWGLLNFRPLTYDYLLRTINVHIFLNKWMPIEFPEAKELIYSALKDGRLFVANDGLAPAKGFRFDFISNDGSDLFMGEEGEFQPGDLVIEAPSKAEIRLIKNGILEKKWRGREAVYRVKEKGVYRVEVYKWLSFFGWRPWIFSNPIYLR
jgi:hypothetical protein